MNKLIYVLFLFSTFSCAIENEVEENIFLDLDNVKSVNISAHFDEVEYILLGEGEADYLVRPYKTIYHDDKIYVEDKALNAIFIFDIKGEFLKTIKGEGKGPGEFFQIDDFQVDGDYIYIQDTYLKKNLVFDLNGEFQNEDKNFYENSHFFKGDDYYLYFIGYNLDYGRYSFIRETKNEKTGYLDIKEGYEGMTKVALINGFTSNTTNKKIFFPVPHSYNIAVFNEKGALINMHSFNFGKYNLKDDTRLEGSEIVKNKIDNSNLVDGIRNFFPLGDKYFITLRQGKNSNIYALMDENLNVSMLTDDLINDLDGMHIRNIPWFASPDKIFFRMRSTDFYNDYIKSFKDTKVEIKKGNVHDFFQNNKLRLKEDKYVLVSLRLK